MGRIDRDVTEFLTSVVPPAAVKRRMRTLSAELAQLQRLFPTIRVSSHAELAQLQRRHGTNGAPLRRKRRARRVAAKPNGTATPLKVDGRMKTGLQSKLLELVPNNGGTVDIATLRRVLDAGGLFDTTDESVQKQRIYATLSRLVALHRLERTGTGTYRRP